MSGQQIGAVVGGAIGAVVGGFAGAQVGMAIGGLIGGAIDPTKTYGPHIGDGQTQSATDGSPIAWVMGTMWTAGTIVDVGPRVEVKVKDKQQGKGGGTQSYHYEAHQGFAILVCESDALKGSTISNVLMVEQDGKIVYDVRPGSTMIADSNKWAANVKFYFGDEAQLTPPALDAIHGAGNSPGYRGVLLAVFDDFNLTSAGDRIPQFRFMVQAKMARLSFPDFTLGTSDTLAVTVDASGVQNTPTNVSTGDYWSYPAPADAYGLVATFTILQAGGGDPLTVGLADASHTHIIDFQPITEDQIDINQRPAMNYFANDFYADSRYLTATALAVGVEYTVSLIMNGDGTYTCTLMRDGAPIGTATANCMQNTPPAYVVFGRTSNINAPAVARFTSVRVFAGAAADLAGATLSICKRGGVTDVSVSGLGQTPVLGYAIAKQMNAVSALGPLLGAYFAYGSEYDCKINFDFYGKDAVMTIDEDDLLEANDANGNAVTANLRNNATEFPRRIVGQYYDPAQNYMPVTVMQTRRAAGITATGDRSFDIPVVMAADAAQQTVDKALKVAYAQLEGTLEFSVPFAGKTNVYLSLVPGDAVLFRGKRWIVTNQILSAGYIKLTLQYDRQGAYTSAVQAIPGLTPTPPQSRYSGPTNLIAMNLPALQSQDGYGLYLAAGPVDPAQNWRGCDVQMSLDSGATWQTVTQVVGASTYGALTAADAGTSLIAQVNGDMVSVGSAQLDAQQNAAALLQGTAAEVLQFGTATEDPVTAHLYTLTGLRRHLLGTTQLAGAVNDQLVMLDNVVLLPIDLAFAGKTIQLRAVGFGEDAAGATVVSIAYNPDMTVIHDGGTVT